MIRKITLAIFIAITLASLSGCRKLALHGDFSGQWQILSIDYPDGTHVDPEGTLFYCFYRDMVQLTNNKGARVSGHLTMGEDTFALYFPYTGYRYIEPWGILPPTDDALNMTSGATEEYTIDKLTSKELIMTTSQGVVIRSRKY